MPNICKIGEYRLIEELLKINVNYTDKIIKLEKKILVFNKLIE